MGFVNVLYIEALKRLTIRGNRNFSILLATMRNMLKFYERLPRAQ